MAILKVTRSWSSRALMSVPAATAYSAGTQPATEDRRGQGALTRASGTDLQRLLDEAALGLHAAKDEISKLKR